LLYLRLFLTFESSHRLIRLIFWFHKIADTEAGASTGFGYHLTCFALGEGDKVVATMRNPESGGKQLRSQFPTHIADGRLFILKLDVKNSQAISQAFETVKERYGCIDVVFNNAGYAIMGEFEGTPEESAREMFDVCFLLPLYSQVEGSSYSLDKLLGRGKCHKRVY
jgi:NAD(P)-dependent dehydrogenase (short-subunit alcohol dehydrogenase family)